MDRTPFNIALAFVSRNRYTITSLLIMLLMLSHLSNKIWEGDFWVHAACVRELTTHPLSPHHPMLSVDIPCVFYSPYMLLVAIFSRSTTLGPIAGLAVAGIINLLLLLISLRVFISSYVKEDAEKTAFYTLLFMLFLWGPQPWFYSGFLHIDVLGYVLPYPATFSFALVLFSFAVYLHILHGAPRTWFIALFLILPTLLLTHPPTALVLYVGLTAFTIGFRKVVTRNILLLLASACAFSILVALLYPYYSFPDLFLKGRDVHEDGADLYARVLPRILPVLIGVIPLLGRLKKDRLDPLVLFFIFLVCLYLYGAVSCLFGYGRVIVYILLLLQMALAMWVAKAETQKNLKVFLILVVYLYIAAPSLPMDSLSSIMRYRPGRGSNYSNLLFLSHYTKQYDVILSDIETSCTVPALGGKVVAYDRPVYWLGNNTRRRDVNYFFSDKASENDRLEIIRRYRVNYILVDMERIGAAHRTLVAFLPFGDVVYRNPGYSLIKIDEGKPVYKHRH